MIPFLIQSVDGRVQDDFSFHLLRAIEYKKWYSDSTIKYLISDEMRDKHIPVGTVEFVTDYFRRFLYKDLKPINVPESLFSFAGRNIENKFFLKPGHTEKFVKSNDAIKSFTEINPPIVPPGNYQISDVVEIDAEFRCFVFNGEVLFIGQYAGDVGVYPDIKIIKEMVKAYKDAPPAYTLDVGVNNSTIVIEVHDFFSCGLYGFQNYNFLPAMFSQWYYWRVKRE